MNRLTRIGVAAALTAVSALALSQGGPPNPEAQAKTAVETRQAVFKLISNQSAVLGAMQRGTRDFDAALAGTNAARIQSLAGMIPELFAANTTAVTTVKTRALPVIWTSQADFKTAADNLAKAAGAVAAAAKSGDATATKAAAAEINKACQTCHETFRGPAAP